MSDDHSGPPIFRYILLGVQNRLRSFAYLLPIIELLFAVMIVVVPALLLFTRLKQKAHGSGTVFLAFGEFGMTIPSDRFLLFAFDRAGWWAEKPVTIVNAPAKFVEALVSLAVARKGYWLPSSLLRSTWHTLIYPIYSLPAWIYVGLGVDALIGRRRVHGWSVILSVVLFLACASFFLAFRFVMPAAERQAQELLGWFIDGFGIWAVLFSIPGVAWLRQRKRWASLKDELLPI